MDTPTLTPSVPNLQDWVVHQLVYDHIQYIDSLQWSIPHNLQCQPNLNISVYRDIDGVSQLVPYTGIFDRNTVNPYTTILTFPKVEKGIAQCVAMASQNVTNPMPIPVVVDTTASTQASTNTGVLTICTLSDAPVVNISITFIVPNGSPITVLYEGITIVPTATSPWAGVGQVFLNGKNYHVRSIDIVNNPKVTALFLSGQIPPAGGFFYLTHTNYINIDPGSVLILGANPPYGAVDRIYDKYVDFSSESATSNGIMYNYGKVYVRDTSIKTTHPQILVV
jgi:hypothetical protein